MKRWAIDRPLTALECSVLEVLIKSTGGIIHNEKNWYKEDNPYVYYVDNNIYVKGFVLTSDITLYTYEQVIDIINGGNGETG